MIAGLLFATLVLGTDPTLRDRAVLTLSADRDSYYVGEPVRLRVTAENRGDAPIRGYLLSRPHHDTVEIEYRHVSKPFVRLATPLARGEEINVKRIPMILDPGEKATSEFVLSYDPRGRRLVLAEPGEFEFRVSYRATPDDREDVLVSNTVTVRVAAPPSQDEDAFRHYWRGGIGLLPQFDPLSSEVDPAVIRDAADLIDKHPTSPYANAAREGLLRALRHRVTHKEATKGESELYEKLKGERPPNP